MEIMERDYKKDLNFKEAQKRVKAIKGFYVHLVVYLVINPVVFILNTRNDGIIEGLTELSSYSSMFFWGIGLVAHWASVFGPNFLFGKEWEERKIKELMDRDKKQIWK